MQDDADFCDNCGYPLSANAYVVPLGRADSGGVARPTAAALPLATEKLTGKPDLDAFISTDLKSKLEQARVNETMVGERRVVTMLFCDVKGSTAAAEQLDPEEWTEIINGAFEYMIKPVYKYEGTVARLMGDAVLAFFGAPIAHEDDPQRAVLAGLDIVAGIEPYREQVERRYGVEFAVRVGINTGMVVVGAVGSDLRMEYTAMGDAINLAARMEQTAEPGTVQIAEDTYRLVAPIFEVESLGKTQLKGKAEPMATYRVLRPKAQPGRLRVSRAWTAQWSGGRRRFERLRMLAEKVQAGEGQIVSIIGEAGLGKSRLIRELRAVWEADYADAATPRWSEMSAPSYHTGQPYDTFQQLLRVYAGIAQSDPPEVAREKLQAMVEADPHREITQTVFEMLLGVHPEGESRLDGETFKRELYASIKTAVQNEVSGQPFIYVYDDLHWTDSASLDLNAHLLKLVRELPILFVLAYRPDRETPVWGLREQLRVAYADCYSELALQPLTDEQGNDLVNNLLAIADLPETLRAQIQEKADGNPFYVEEIVRTLIEQDIVVQNEDGTRSGMRWVT